MHPRGSLRSGFTLIELLVVMAIISILIGLLVPAVQKVREAAARMQCSNNMKQFTLAVHSFEAQRNRLPPSWGYPNPSNPNAIIPGGPLSQILPYIEQNTVGYNPLLGWTNNANWGPAKTQIRIFLCPSVAGDDRLDLSPYLAPNVNGPMAVADYFAFTFIALTDDRGFYPVGNGPAAGGVPYTFTGAGTTYGGAFDYFNEIRMLAIRDGLSNTIMFAERAGVPDLWTRTHITESSTDKVPAQPAFSRPGSPVSRMKAFRRSGRCCNCSNSSQT